MNWANPKHNDEEHIKLLKVMKYYHIDSSDKLIQALIDREYEMIKRCDIALTQNLPSCNHSTFTSCDDCPYENTKECNGK